MKEERAKDVVSMDSREKDGQHDYLDVARR